MQESFDYLRNQQLHEGFFSGKLVSYLFIELVRLSDTKHRERGDILRLPTFP